MTHIIETQNGIAITVNIAEGDFAPFKDQLNDKKILAIPISNMVLNKNHIRIVYPETQPELGPSVRQVFTAEGKLYRTFEEDFNAPALATELNNLSIDYVRIGDIIVHKHNVNLIK